jgi:translocation and assembly module TamA
VSAFHAFARGRGLVRAILIAALALLGGCALLPGSDHEAAPRRPSPVKLTVQAPDDLRKLLEQQLDLARLPKLAGDRPVSEAELQRLLEALPRQARTLIESEGYFQSRIDVQREPGEPPRVRVAVDPGPRVHVGPLRLDVHGALADAARNGDAGARAALAAFHEKWRLPSGAVFRAADWSGAKTAALAQLRAAGYLRAQWQDTEARVDARTAEAALTLDADSGPLYRTGELRISGLARQDERVVRNLADFSAGSPATETLLLDFQERLQKSGLFDGATVLVDPSTTDDPDAVPVAVQLSEQKIQQATLGVGIDANVGPRITLDHEHRRVFGRALTARNRFELGPLRRAWDGELSTQPLPGLYRNLVGGSLEQLESDSDVTNSLRVRVGRAQDKKRLSRLLFVELERSTTRTKVEPISRSQSNAVSLQYHSTWRHVDDVLLPTRGQVLNVQLGVGEARATPGDSGPFGRAYAKLNSYWPLPRSWYGQTRLELGQVFARDTVLAPESLRFRAGGDDSVRGYAYRSLAPVVNGALSSGNVLFTASAEVAHPLLARLPALWGAAFIDAGRAAQRWSDLKPAVGIGVGLRYRSPVGPLSLDLAWGQEVRRFRLHLTAGVTF